MISQPARLMTCFILWWSQRPVFELHDHGSRQKTVSTFAMIGKSSSHEILKPLNRLPSCARFTLYDITMMMPKKHP